MCSYDLKCAVMKGCLCSDKKGHSEFWLDETEFFLSKKVILKFSARNVQ